MKNENSYSEKMKRHAMSKHQKESHSFIQSIYAQMVLDEVLYYQNRKQLEKQINEALDTNNETLFYKLAKEYAKLSPA